MEKHTEKRKAERPDVGQVQSEVRAISANLSGLMRELDRRRREAFSVKRHPARMIAIAVALTALVAGAVTLLVLRRRRRHSLPARVTVFREALRRVSAHPERLGKSDGVTRRSLQSAGSAAASVIGRRFAERLMG